MEKPPVDQITNRCLTERGFQDRISVCRGNMFVDVFPEGCDIHLFSNVLHDWDIDRVEQLLRKSHEALPPGGMVVIHDAHIDATKTGPLPVAAYSVILMALTEGKCYSQSEMTSYLTRAGFISVSYSSTAADRSVITARKVV